MHSTFAIVLKSAVVAAVLVMTLWSGTGAAQPQPEGVVKAVGGLLQGIASIERYVTTAELSAVHSEDVPLSAAISLLERETGSLPPEARDPVRLNLSTLRRKISDLHEAADAFDLAKTQALLKDVLAAHAIVTRQYPDDTIAAARVLADRHTCPMHPTVVGRNTELCGKCGMPLDQPVRIPVLYSGGTPATRTVSAAIKTDRDVEPGLPVNGILTLTSFGQPVLLTDLRVVHTERIHLLLIEPTLTDYHHVHPRPTETPGEYAFSFTPGKSGPYRAWADVRTTSTGLQEYAVTNIASRQPGDQARDTSVKLRSDVDHLRFELSLDGPLRVGQPGHGKLVVTDALGQPFQALEPLMGTFAHLVGFNEDYKTVLHTHPRTAGVLKPEDRGGPQLEFQLYATQPGFYRLFAQVQVQGVSRYAAFGVNISAAE